MAKLENLEQKSKPKSKLKFRYFENLCVNVVSMRLCIGTNMDGLSVESSADWPEQTEREQLKEVHEEADSDEEDQDRLHEQRVDWPHHI